MLVESRPLNELRHGFNRFEWVRKRRESAKTVWVAMGGREWRVYVLRLGRDNESPKRQWFVEGCHRREVWYFFLLFAARSLLSRFGLRKN